MATDAFGGISVDDDPVTDEFGGVAVATPPAAPVAPTTDEFGGISVEEPPAPSAPAKEEIPDSGFWASTGASIASNVTNAAAFLVEGPHEPSRGEFIEGKTKSIKAQEEGLANFDAMLKKRGYSTADDDRTRAAMVRTLEGERADMETRLKADYTPELEAKRTARNADTEATLGKTAASMRDYANREVWDLYGANPHSTNTLAQAGRGLGSVTAAIPTMALGGLGLPAAAVQMSGGAYEQARFQKETELKAQGIEDPAVLKWEGEHAGSEALKGSLVGLSVYMIGGKLAGSMVSKLAGPEASALTKGLLSFTGAAVTNVGVGSVLRALEAEPGHAGEAAIPKVENLTADTLFAVFHGLGDYGHASKAAKAKAKEELLRRDFTEKEIETPATPPPDGVAPPADEIKLTPEQQKAKEDAEKAARDAADAAAKKKADDVEAAGLPATADALRDVAAKKVEDATPPPPEPEPVPAVIPEIHRPEVELLDALRNPLPPDEPSQRQQNQAGAEPSTPSETATEQPLPGMDETPGPAPASEVPAVTYVQPDRAARRGDVSVPVNVNAFDAAWKKDPGFYVGEGGTGEIAGRRKGFADWRKANPGKPIETPEVSFDAEGNPVFTNGRHRFASLRDEGQKTIEVSMSPEDAARARANGMAADSPAEKPAAPPEVPTETKTGLPTEEIPLDQLSLSEDVPQFKGGADEQGVVEPLAGKYDRRGVGPIQIWRRLNGKLEIISGRHRFDLAKRSGEKTIPGQIHNEADGFDAVAAASLDAELNIRDGQGSTADYASYFRHAELSEADASARGLLARAKGRAGFSIATRASEDVFALHQSGKLTDAAAEAVANAAPNNDAAQRLGVRAIFGGASIADAANAIRAALAGAGEARATQGDFFSDSGLDEQWLAQGRVASQRQKALREEISAVQGAAKKPELARKHGVDVKDPAGVQRRISELRDQLTRWEDWYKHPDLVKITKGEEPSKGTQLKAGQKQGDLLAGTTEDAFNLAGETAPDNVAAAERAAQAEREAAEAKRIQDEQQGNLFGARKGKADTGTPDMFAEAGTSKEPAAPLKDAYQKLVAADPYKFPAVAISDLARESGVPLEKLKARLLELHKQGKVVLSIGDWSLSSEANRAGVINLHGDRMLQVRPIGETVFESKTPPAGEATPEAAFRKRLLDAAAKAKSEADYDASGKQAPMIDFERPDRPGSKTSILNTREALTAAAERFRPATDGTHLQRVADQIEEAKRKVSGVHVVVVRNEGDLPARVRSRLDPRAVHEGLANTGSKQVYIFAGNIATPERALEVFAHEVVGHLGVEKIVKPAEWQNLVDSIISRAPEGLSDIMAKYAEGKTLDTLTPEERTSVAKEYIARMAEKPSRNPTIWRQIVDTVRNGLRNIGIVKEWKESDIRNLLRRASDAMKANPAERFIGGEDGDLRGAVKDLGPDVETHSPYATHIEEALEKALPDENSRAAVDRYVAAKMAGETAPALVGPERAVAERFLTYFRSKAEFAKRNGVAGAVQDAYEAALGKRPDMQLAERLATYSAETNRIVTEKTAPRPESVSAPAAPDSSPTSIRNAVVDSERAKRGLPPAMEPARREFGTVWDEAMREVDANPDAPRELVDSLENKPRPMTDKENALLLHRQITLQGEFDRSARAVVEAREGGDAAAAQEHGVRAAVMADELQRLYDVGKRVGTANARGLNSRKMLANEDYSLATMTLKKREANGGRPLEPAEQTQLELDAKSIAEKTKLAEEAAAKVDQTRATAAATEAVKETVAKVKPAKPKSTKPPKVGNEAPAASERTKSWLEKQADAARQRIKDRGPRLMAGIDPVDLADRVIVGAADIAGGLRDFAGWATKQIRDWGEKITPHLQEIWDRSNALVKQHENTAKYAAKMVERVQEDGATLGQLRGYIRKVAEELVRGGTTELNPLLDQLHPIVEEALPGTTRRQVMDVFSGYGEFRPLDKDAVKAQVRDLRGQAQQTGKIQDMQAGTAPKKTGPERRTPSDKERALIKEVESMKKKGGYTVTNPESQLKTAMQAIKTRLRNQIVDLATRLDTGERPPGKAGVKYDQEAETLRALRDRIKQTLADLEGKPTMTEEQRLKSATDAVQRSIDEYNRRLREDDYSAKRGGKPVTSPELETMRSERDALKAEYQELRELHEDVIRERGERREQDLAAQIAELDRKMREGDTAPAPRDSSEPTQKAEDLKAERDAMQKQLDEMRKPVLTPEERAARAQARALAGYKARTAGRIAELQRKLAAGDFAPRPPRAALQLDEHALRLQADLARAKTEFDRGLVRDRLAKRNVYERTLDGAAKWRRAFVLSGFHTLAKLTSAAGEIIGIAPIEEAAGGVIGKLPGVRQVAEQAPRHGGFSARAEIEAVTANVTKLFKDVGDYMKTGATDLDAVFGDAHLYPFEWKEMIGRIHGMLKTPARRNEWTRSFRKRMDFAARQGVDITDPVVQSKIGLDAYKDANKSIFMEDNILVDGYNRMLSQFSQPDKITGRPSAGGKALEAFTKFSLPVVRIPTNIVARTFEYSVGTVSGSVKLGLAFRRGIENMPPEHADLIMRNFKRGSLGAAVLLLGFLNPKNVGGYYSGKRDEEDVKPGEVRLFGVNIPKVLVHNPLLEQLQLGATVRRVMDSKIRGGTDTQGIGAGLWAAAMGLIQETPFVNQMIRQAKAFAPHGQEAYFGELMKSLAPQILQELANHGDIDPATGKPRKRKPATTWQYVKTGIPGLRKSVPEKK